jgi:hypothetical protein
MSLEIVTHGWKSLQKFARAAMRYNNFSRRTVHKMERVSRLIGRLPSGGSAIDAEGLARAAWPAAVGKKIAARTRTGRMVRTKLIVEVEDKIWQRQLFALSGQILSSLARQLGPGIVEEVEFRIVPPRRDFQRAETAQSALISLDDADQIADSDLRRIYRNARKKALA